MEYRARIIFVYITVIALAIMLSTFIFMSDRKLSESSNELFSNTFPALQEIGRLKQARIEHERLLYEYYATTDFDRLRPKITESRQAITANLMSITKGNEIAVELEPVHAEYDTIYMSAAQLDQTLAHASVDWDRARALLVSISDAGRRMDPYLDKLAADIESKARADSATNQEQRQLGTKLVIGFSVVIVALAILMGIAIDRYIRETAERKKLAMFAERNPSPVVSTDLNGEVLYQNPATKLLLDDLKSHSNHAQILLPSDFKAQIATMVKAHQDKYTGIIEIKHRTLQYTISLLNDLKLCHVHFEDITEQTKAQLSLQYQAFHHPLTDLPNRRNLEDLLEAKLTEDRDNNESFCLMLVSLHHFDKITSIHGYQFGDELIQRVAYRLKIAMAQFHEQCFERSLFHLDSTTFGVLIKNAEKGKALQAAKDLKRTMTKTIVHGDNQFHLSLRIGISNYPKDSDCLSGMLRTADAALVQAKQDEHVSVQSYDESIHQNEQRLMLIESELRIALEEKELCLFYQPKVDAQTGQVNNAEALIRWHRNNKILYTPFEFIPVAEQSGLIIPIGERVIETAADQALEWKQNHPINIAVNLSSRQFQHTGFLDHLKDLTKKIPGIEKILELEITESLLMQDIHQSIELMHQIKNLGFKLSIDDFGTGYSSLSYLKEFPIDKLKIDRSFIMNMDTNKEDQTLVKTIVSLSKSLGLETVAEGVETEKQFELLRDFGCEEIQGYYFSQPLPADKFEERIILPASAKEPVHLAAQVS